MVRRRVISAFLLAFMFFSLGAVALAGQDAGPVRQAEYEVHVFLLAASNEQQAGRLPEAVEPLAGEIRAATQLRGARLVTTFVHRVSELGHVNSSGIAPPLPGGASSASTPTFYNLRVDRIAPSRADNSLVGMRQFVFGMRLPISTSRVEDGKVTEPTMQYEQISVNSSL